MWKNEKVCSLCLSTSHTRSLSCSRDGNLLNCLTNQYSCLFDLHHNEKIKLMLALMSDEDNPQLHPGASRAPISSTFHHHTWWGFHHHHLWHQHHGTGEHSLPSRAGGGEGEAGGVAAGGDHQLHLQPSSQAPRKWSVSGKEKSCGLIMSYSLFRDKSHTKRRGAQLVT